jgi:hypothetical protein
MRSAKSRKCDPRMFNFVVEVTGLSAPPVASYCGWLAIAGVHHYSPEGFVVIEPTEVAFDRDRLSPFIC